MRHFYMGIDIGQSSTRAILCDESGTMIKSGVAGAYNRAFEEGGIRQFRSMMSQLVAGMWKEEELQNIFIDSIAIGMSYGWNQVDEIKDILPSHRLLQAQWDGVTALRGAVNKLPGIIVIAGTGAVAMSMDEQGHTERCGGWGYLLGDEGSAYSIGHQAMQQALRSYDGRSGKSALEAVVLDHFSESDLFGVKAGMMGGKYTVDEVASLSKRVSALAYAGDLDCIEILTWAGRELAQLPTALIRRRCVPENTPIAHVGGVFNDQLVMKTYQQALKEQVPGANILSAKLPPLFGALILSYEADGQVITEQHLTKWEKLTIK